MDLQQVEVPEVREETEQGTKQAEIDEQLTPLLRAMVRCAALAVAVGAHELLQTALSVAVNVITLIQPTPEECVSPGVKSSNGPRSRELQGRGRHLQVLSAGLPHPQRHADFLPDEYRMRE